MAFPFPINIVNSPFRLLILTPTPPTTSSSEAFSPIAPLLTALTSSEPSPEQISTGFAGYTTHAPLQLRTKYYNASIGIWCDEVGLEWKEIMADAAEEASEVRGAIGGIVCVVDSQDLGEKGKIENVLDTLERVEEVRVMCEDEGAGREVAGVVLVVGDNAEEKVDAVEEGLRGERGVFGWDVVAWDGDEKQYVDATVKNDYGEKFGIERVKEILEAVPWTTSSPDEEADFLDGNDDDVDWTTTEQRELDREMMGLKMDLHEDENHEVGDEDEDEAFTEDQWPELQGGNGSEDVKVEQLQGFMERLIATREAATELSGPEKQRFARREVERIMREMG